MGAKKLESIFSEIPDPRINRNKRYPLLGVLGIAVFGLLGGMNNFTEIAIFAEAHEEELKKFLNLSAGVPSHDTIRRVFLMINPKFFHECFVRFVRELGLASGEQIAIDGKTTRNSGDNALNLVSAWCKKNGLVLGQVKVSNKSNEIIAIPELLRLLNIEGCVVSIDAMGCQRKIAQQIVDSKGEYLLALKRNHAELYEHVADMFGANESISSHWIEYDKGHGRCERREYRMITDTSRLRIAHEWPGLKGVVMVISKRTVGTKVSIEKRFYLSSLAEDAQKMGGYVRSHWGIENKLHWTLDVTMKDDAASIRNDYAAENMAILRRLTLNILKLGKEPKDYLPGARIRCSSISYATQMLLKVGTLYA
jgi:predicted transposase YbfD/YdcC